MDDRDMARHVARIEKTDKLLKEVDNLMTEIIRKYSASESIIDDRKAAISKINELLEFGVADHELRNTLKLLKNKLETIILR